MAIKGLAYPKTTWAFQERPVASAKLNNWDDRIEAALELAYFLLNLAWGGGSGVLRGASAEDLRVTAADPPGLAAVVQPGYAFISHAPYKLAQPLATPEAAEPGAQPRIDLVQARLASWDVSLKPGAESATPVPPSPDADALPLAHLYLRPGMTVIKQTDDSENGYIIDARTYL